LDRAGPCAISAPPARQPIRRFVPASIDLRRRLQAFVRRPLAVLDPSEPTQDRRQPETTVEASGAPAPTAARQPAVALRDTSTMPSRIGHRPAPKRLSPRKERPRNP